MAILLSIDMDFHTPNRGEAGEKTITCRSPKTGETVAVHPMMLWDWGHSEGYTPALQEILWQSRYNAFRRVGLDPLEACPLAATPSLELFAQEVTRRCERMEDAILAISDSHAFGLQVAQTAAFLGSARYRRPLDRILHFDAHHDLGYSDGEVRKWTEKRSVDCGTWLFAALEMGVAKGADVVYPDWRVIPEGRPKHSRWKEVSRRVKFYSWSEWRANGKDYGKVAATHLCRSSAWVPPWHDGAFQRLVDLLPRQATCLDCAPGGQRIGGHDACRPRKWDRAQAERDAAAYAKAMAP